MPSMIPLLPSKTQKDMKIQVINIRIRKMKNLGKSAGKRKKKKCWEWKKPVITTSSNMYPFIKL